MKAQHENLLMESFGLWLDNTILTKGEAFYHYTGLLYEVSGNYANNTRVWAAPFKQAIADQNIAGTIKPIKVWINNTDIFDSNTGYYQLVNSFDFDNSQLIIKNNTISGMFQYNGVTGDRVGITGFIPNGVKDYVFELKLNSDKRISGLHMTNSDGDWWTFNNTYYPIGITTGNLTGLYTGNFGINLNLSASELKAKLYIDSSSIVTPPPTDYYLTVYYTDNTSDVFYQNDNISTVGNPVISGAFSFKEFGVKFTNLPEEQLLFETRFKPNKQSFYDGINNTAPFLTNKSGLNGLTTDKIPYSVVYIRNNGGYNEEFQFGGTVATQTNVRAIILSDSLYNLDAISNILKDQKERYVPILAKNEMPFNQFGFPMSGVAGFNYGQISSGLVPVGGPHSAFIKEVRATNLTSNSRILNEFQKLNPNIYPGFVDFTLETYREPI